MTHKHMLFCNNIMIASQAFAAGTTPVANEVTGPHGPQSITFALLCFVFLYNNTQPIEACSMYSRLTYPATPHFNFVSRDTLSFFERQAALLQVGCFKLKSSVTGTGT